MEEIKIVFTGTVGAGKTKAIRSLSEIDVISTEERASDNVGKFKKTTTVTMDYGELKLNKTQTLALYGTPGQKRFSFMWDILARGALGFIILVDDSRRDPIADLNTYLEKFKTYINETTVVIGVTHLDSNRKSGIQKYHHLFKKLNLSYPVIPVDARNKEEVRILVHSLVSMLEVT